MEAKRISLPITPLSSDDLTRHLHLTDLIPKHLLCTIKVAKMKSFFSRFLRPFPQFYIPSIETVNERQSRNIEGYRSRKGL